MQGPDFSMSIWNSFLASRLNPHGDVSFSEISMWLCVPPGGRILSDKEAILSEQARLNDLHQQQAQEEFEIFKAQVSWFIMRIF